MTKKRLAALSGTAAFLGLSAALGLVAQQSDILIKITKGERPVIAVPDFRASGEAQQYMGAFNQTLWDDLEKSGVFRMASKSMYPLRVPQQPKDFLPPLPSGTSDSSQRGFRMQDWAGPPVNANYVVFGYAAAQGEQLALFGWLYNVTQTTAQAAQVLGKIYLGGLDEAGARKVAHEFAADILGQFGIKSLLGSKIYFVSDRTGHKEIWSMDHDGGNQSQLTFFKSISTMPGASPDGSKIAFTTFVRGTPQITIFSTASRNRLPFYNQRASLNAFPSFTPDGNQILYSSTATGISQIYIANTDGSGFRRISSVQSIEVEPKVNPKNASEIVFVSGRSGVPQIYRMNIDGADVTRLTTGEGHAVNPAWSPDGQHIAFAWTRGYEPGNFNVFVMDVATRQFVQLTHGVGRNENPTWAPDGRHIVFSSNRSGSTQIWTMLADGTQLQRLTSQGRNEKPVWSAQ
ncbi:MAG: hypothetical protein LC130_24170 [Bryobacterales bacterium]|nr:hypothetical protein [Bryobacterales bacterium]MEB2360909.1 hypothetical protein [Bryobacterales bacterium]